MSDAAPKSATYADIEALPPNVVGELLFGSLVTHPRPSPRHVLAVNALGAAVSNPFQFGTGGPGGWVFAIEPELHLGPNVVVPDIAGWRREHLPALPDTNWFETPPDWICEVLSPSTEKSDKGPKRHICANYEVDHLWLVEPRARSLEVFARKERDWLLTHTYFDADDVIAPPFSDLTLSLALLWPLDTIANKEAP